MLYIRKWVFALKNSRVEEGGWEYRDGGGGTVLNRTLWRR